MIITYGENDYDFTFNVYENDVQGEVDLKIHGGEWFAPPGNGIGNGIFMNIMTVYDGENVITDYDVRLADETAGTIEKTLDGRIKFIPLKVGQTTMIITYGENDYEFIFNVEEHDVNGGNQGGNNNNNSAITIYDTEFNRLQGTAVAFDELVNTGDTRSFYVAYQGKESGYNLNAQMVDHYLSMDNKGGSGVVGDVIQTAVSFTAVKQNLEGTTDDGTPIPNSEYFEVLRAGNLPEDGTVYIFKGTFNNDTLKSNTYRTCGLSFGQFKLTHTNDNKQLARPDFAVCCSGFKTDNTLDVWGSRGNIMFMEEPEGQPLDVKTLKLYETIDSPDNAVYVGVPNGSTNVQVRAYLQYSNSDNEYLDITDQAISWLKPLENQQGDLFVYQVLIESFYGHNNIILVATADVNGETYHKSLILNKAVQYKYTKDTLAVADDPHDFNNKLVAATFGYEAGESRLQEYTNGNNVTLVDAAMGNKHSWNLPYSGGYYGTVMRLADGYRLEDVRTLNGAGEETDIHLPYIIIHSIYYKVTTDLPVDEINQDAFVTYSAMQIPHNGLEDRNNPKGEFIVQLDIPLVEYHYDSENGIYWPDLINYNGVLAAIHSYENLVTWLNGAFGSYNNYEIEFLDTCMYYDIGIRPQDSDIVNLYNQLNQIGTVEFVTAPDSTDNFAGKSNEVGLKPSDKHSRNSWGEEYKFNEFKNTVGDSAKEKEHEDDLCEFHGNDDEKVVGAYGFKMDGDDTFKGMLDVYIPVPENVKDHSSCRVYWMNGGKPIPMPARYVDGYMAFTTSHFSDYVLVADANDVEEETNNNENNNNTTINPGISGGLPSAPPKQEDTVTNTAGTTTTAPSTNADMSQSTTMKGNETTTTVEQTTADKIVENAVSNKSEEVVIDATYHEESSNQSTKEATVEIPTETIAQIAEKTEADVTIKTDVAEIKLDTEALAAVAEQAEGKSVSVVAEKVKADAKEIRVELKVVCSEGNVISDFKGGNISVTVEAPKGKKDVVCVYIDEQGHWHTVPGQLNADGTYTFTTGHFSTYAIVDADHAEDTIAAQKEAIRNIKFKLSSKQVKTKKGKKAIKLTWSGTDVVFDGVEFQRSLKKNSGYGKKPFFTTKEGAESYTNTSVKKGTRYYYRARGFVTIDGEKVYTKWSTKAWRKIK